jgi:hypothetical protein
VVDGCLLAPQALLLLQFLVEAEHGAFGLLHVTCAAATGGVDGIFGWWG